MSLEGAAALRGNGGQRWVLGALAMVMALASCGHENAGGTMPHASPTASPAGPVAGATLPTALAFGGYGSVDLTITESGNVYHLTNGNVFCYALGQDFLSVHVSHLAKDPPPAINLAIHLPTTRPGTIDASSVPKSLTASHDIAPYPFQLESSEGGGFLYSDGSDAVSAP